MIAILEFILDFIVSMAGMALTLIVDVCEFTLGILGGIASLLITLAGFAFVLALLAIFIRRRKKAAQSDLLVDENGETFTSFYRQEKE